ncbi:hypothetical protein LAJ19_06980 [Deinococcus taeanensis]|uniref:hypothetical protein n=1 Tax=Deinococcus taeanensis TaxID=2737050 RepID=UPI001CDCDF52|nr:hypothetical protein [Deinococcus taeanensis]UBV41418.1 hypothetical protein LAJ19_06980 [Deinococcus taeanensis]
MTRTWRTLLGLAGSLSALLLMQPLTSRPTPEEQATARAQRRRMQATLPLATPVQALAQGTLEALRVLTGQPARRPRGRR